PREDHYGLLVPAHRVPDDRAGVLPEPGGLQAGARGLGVGVGVARQYLIPDEVLDEAERAAGGRVVGVRDATWPEWSPHHLVITDDRFTDATQQRRLGRGGGGVHGTHGAGDLGGSAIAPAVRWCRSLSPYVVVEVGHWRCPRRARPPMWDERCRRTPEMGEETVGASRHDHLWAG